MSEKKENEKKDQPKRILGDEWKDWDNTGERQESESSKILFLNISLLSFSVIISLGFLFLYLISPRLSLISANLHFFAKSLFLFLVAVFTCWSFLVFFEIFFSRQISFFGKTHAFFIKLFYPLGIRISQVLRINKDVFSNSFLKVSNFLIGESKSGKVKKTLVLLPRCLEKSVKKDIEVLTEEKNVPVYVVGGGEQARKIIKKERPDSVIAVACERDLVAGINDVSHKLAVIGIPNKRPNGPCLNTHIDIKQLEEAIKIFTVS
jgi:hypothetical protein